MKLILDAVCLTCGATIKDGAPVMLVARGKATTVDKACIEQGADYDGEEPSFYQVRNKAKDTHLPEGKIRVITAGRPSKVNSPGFRVVLCEECAEELPLLISEMEAVVA